MPFADPPRVAAWRHREARTGFEVVFLRSDAHGCRVEGDTAAIEDGEAWADAPAAYVRARDLSVERLEQRYRRLDDDGDRQRYHYAAPGFGFECELSYDKFGLVLDYPGIAVRAG